MIDLASVFLIKSIELKKHKFISIFVHLREYQIEIFSLLT